MYVSHTSPKRQYAQLLFPLSLQVQDPNMARLIGYATTILVDKIHVDGNYFHFLVPSSTGLMIDAPASNFTGWTAGQLRRLIGEEFIPLRETLRLKFFNPATASLMRNHLPNHVNYADEVFASAVKVAQGEPTEFRSIGGRPMQAENFRGSWSKIQLYELIGVPLQPVH